MMVDSIRTFTGVFFTPLSPKKEDVRIDDIAHALSLMTRANGHFPYFYSVAQHSIACCKEAIARGYSDRVVLACLLHDAGEAYMSDITRPVKKLLDFYVKAEENLLDVIYSSFLDKALTIEEKLLVKLIDDTMLYHEFLHFMNFEVSRYRGDLVSKPKFDFVDFRQVESEFKSLFTQWKIK